MQIEEQKAETPQRFAASVIGGAAGGDGGRSGGFVTRDADATSRGTVPNRTVQYRTIPCLTLQEEPTTQEI